MNVHHSVTSGAVFENNHKKRICLLDIYNNIVSLGRQFVASAVHNTLSQPLCICFGSLLLTQDLSVMTNGLISLLLVFMSSWFRERRVGSHVTVSLLQLIYLLNMNVMLSGPAPALIYHSTLCYTEVSTHYFDKSLSSISIFLSLLSRGAVFCSCAVLLFLLAPY